MERKIKVFISYSWVHDDDKHQEKALRLHSQLSDAGFDVNIDEDKENGRGKNWRDTWPQWMRKSIQEADVVICITSENYKSCFDGNDQCISRGGINWEGLHLENDLVEFNKHVEVIAFSKDDTQYLPDGLRGESVNFINIDSQDIFFKSTGKSLMNRLNRLRNDETMAHKKIDSVKNIAQEVNQDKNLVQKWDLHKEIRNNPELLSCILSKKKPRSEKHKNILAHELDQKDLYISHESVKKWEEWETSSIAESGKKSISAFQEFLKIDSWKNIMKDIDTVIDLGVGSGKKTLDIIHAFRKQHISSDDIDLVIVDESEYMLQHSSETIFEGTQDENYYITINGLHRDFMELTGAKQSFQGSRLKQSAFFLLGGTFGNINEDRFIESLTSVMNPGDYLILGVFLIDKKIDVSKKYDTTIIEEMFSPSLKELGFSLVENTENHKSKVTKGSWKTFGEEGNNSCVKGSKSIQFYAHVKDDYNDKLISEIEASLELSEDHIGNEMELFNSLRDSLRNYEDEKLITEIKHIQAQLGGITIFKEKIASIVKDYVSNFEHIELFRTTRYDDDSLNAYMKDKKFSSFDKYIEGNTAYLGYKFKG